MVASSPPDKGDGRWVTGRHWSLGSSQPLGGQSGGGGQGLAGTGPLAAVAVALLVGPDSALVLQPQRRTYAEDAWPERRPAGAARAMVSAPERTALLCRCATACAERVVAGTARCLLPERAQPFPQNQGCCLAC